MRKFPFPSSEIRLLMTITKSRWNERILSFLKFIIFKPSFISFLLEELRRPSFLPCLFPNKHVEEYRRVSSNARLRRESVDFRGRGDFVEEGRGSINIFARRKKIADERRVARSLARSLVPPAPGYYWIECITSNDT